MKCGAILVVMMTGSQTSAWVGHNNREFPMPDIEACTAAVKNGQFTSGLSAGIAAFCRPPRPEDFENKWMGVCTGLDK